MDNNPTILIVENESTEAELISNVLTKEGYGTCIANGALEAGHYVVEKKPSLITLDLNMPGFSGFQFLDKIRNIPEGEKIPILVVSGQEEEVLIQTVHRGANDFLRKPFEIDQLTGKVKKLLGSS